MRLLPPAAAEGCAKLPINPGIIIFFGKNRFR
jgi:hypothetical protein